MTTVSVVTGGAGAMGSACRSRVGPRSTFSLLTDCDESRLGCEAEKIEPKTGTSVTRVVGDIADPDVIAELAARAAELGELHSLVHTAGVSPSMAPWREILRVDLTGAARLLDAFLENVVAGSAAVCLASISGHMGAFDPEMDAVLDRRSAPTSRSASGSQLSAEPDPGSTYRLAEAGLIRLCERAAVVWGAPAAAWSRSRPA